MSKNKQIFVSPNGGNWWKVKQPWNQKASAIVDTKKEAIEIAQNIARNQGLETKIQNLDWKISWWNSYWNDPCPPKDKS
jgi:hypothetical protein